VEAIWRFGIVVQRPGLKSGVYKSFSILNNSGLYPELSTVRRSNAQPPAVGSRIRFTALGSERCHRLKSHTGIIVGANPIGTSFSILLDGRKLPLTLHASYIELDDEQRPSGAAE
jgi:hypothetical protein